MDLSHEFTVPAPVAETWDALNDIASVAECFPGAQVTGVDGDTFTGTVKVKLGPIALVYNGTGTFVDKDEVAGTMTIAAKGKDKRGNGTAGADVTVALSDADGGTRVHVVTDLNITGKPAQFGRGVIQDVSDKLLGQFTACLQTKVGASDEPPEPPVAVVPAPVGQPTADDRAGDLQPQTVPAGSAGLGTPSGAAAGSHRPEPAARPGGDDDALDLGTTVLPVLARAYWKQGLGALVAVLLLVRLLGRRR